MSRYIGVGTREVDNPWVVKSFLSRVFIVGLGENSRNGFLFSITDGTILKAEAGP